MAKIARAFQKIFAGGITPTGNIGVFGSLAAGSPAYSSDADTIQSLDAWTNGWAAATVNNQSPAFQDFNGYQYVVTRQLAYLMQAGIPEWNSQTTYYIGSFCQVSGVIYKSLTDVNLNNAVTDLTNWTNGVPVSNKFLSTAIPLTTVFSSSGTNWTTYELTQYGIPSNCTSVILSAQNNGSTNQGVIAFIKARSNSSGIVTGVANGSGLNQTTYVIGQAMVPTSRTSGLVNIDVLCYASGSTWTQGLTVIGYSTS